MERRSVRLSTPALLGTMKIPCHSDSRIGRRSCRPGRGRTHPKPCCRNRGARGRSRGGARPGAFACGGLQHHAGDPPRANTNVPAAVVGLRVAQTCSASARPPARVAMCPAKRGTVKLHTSVGWFIGPVVEAGCNGGVSRSCAPRHRTGPARRDRRSSGGSRYGGRRRSRCDHATVHGAS